MYGSILLTDQRGNDIAMDWEMQDLEIYHTGNDTYIDHNATGHLYIRQQTNTEDIYIQYDNSGNACENIYCDGRTG